MDLNRLVNSLKRTFGKSLQWSGRASLFEFWSWTIVVFIIDGLLSGISKTNDGATGVIFGLLGAIFSLIVLLPSLAVTARRLHDTGKSAVWMLLYFVPFIGWLVLLILCALGSSLEGDKYGTVEYV